MINNLTTYPLYSVRYTPLLIKTYWSAGGGQGQNPENTEELSMDVKNSELSARVPYSKHITHIGPPEEADEEKILVAQGKIQCSGSGHSVHN